LILFPFFLDDNEPDYTINVLKTEWPFI